jgi:hypothetical protein
MRRKLLYVVALTFLLAGGASAATLLKRVTLHPGHCITVAKTRVCAPRAKTVTRWRTVTLTAAPTSTASASSSPTISDAFLNLQDNDQQTRLTQFTTVSPNLTTGASGDPPILHLVFGAPLAGDHHLQVYCEHVNDQGNVDLSHVASDGTLQSGWSSVYVPLSSTYCDYYLGNYRVQVVIDGETTSVDLRYTVVQS